MTAASIYWRTMNHSIAHVIDGTKIPVARLLHIVTSKHAAGRDKDRLFLATHRDALEQLLMNPEQD
jgi:hypothetical protein